jgi:4-amino-4-deoxy-L-arabinose transferase-like glycosyltransferase
VGLNSGHGIARWSKAKPIACGLGMLSNSRIGLPLIFLTGLILRSVCAIRFSGEISQEGAEYASIARSLLEGGGYVGIGQEGPNLFFPPLFPFLIEGVTFLTGDVEMSGLIVNVCMGSILVFPVYLIARQMYDKRLALGAAFLIGLHPFLIRLSATVFCESTFVTIVMAASAMAILAMAKPTGRALATTGGLYALAYLVRPEGLVYMLVGTLLIAGRLWLRSRQITLSALRRVLLVPAVFLLLAGPYIGWLSLQIGEFRIEGKSPLNIETVMRMQQGASMDEARMLVDADLNARGVAIQPHRGVIRSFKPDIKSLMLMAASKCKSVIRDAAVAITSSLEFGSLPLFVLVVLGFFGRPWGQSLAMIQAYLVSILFTSVLATLCIYYTDDRFYVLFVVCFCIWAPVGIAFLVDWAQRSASAFAAGWHASAAVAIRNLAVIAVLLPSAFATWSALIQSRATRPVKEASVNFGRTKGEVRFADTSTLFAFYSHARFTFLPYCDEATAIRYLREKGVTHVVVRDSGLNSRPYLSKWMETGVSDAHEVLRTVARNGERIRVFQIVNVSDR